MVDPRRHGQVCLINPNFLGAVLPRTISAKNSWSPGTIAYDRGGVNRCIFGKISNLKNGVSKFFPMQQAFFRKVFSRFLKDARTKWGVPKAILTPLPPPYSCMYMVGLKDA